MISEPINRRIPALEYAAKISYSSLETLMFSYDCARAMRSMPGFYVECGVAAGAQVIAMAAGAPGKTIYAFDSFEGIPLPSNRDDQMPGIAMLSKAEQQALPDPGKQALISSGATAVSMEDVSAHLTKAGILEKNVIFVKGWFEETVPAHADLMEPISILRLDGDLYNSTFVCLQHLFPKVITGGMVIIDDWELPGCRAACDEYFELIGYAPNWKFVSNIAYFLK
jgi:predicted O-methyltransferase YrrM